LLLATIVTLPVSIPLVGLVSNQSLHGLTTSQEQPAPAGRTLTILLPPFHGAFQFIDVTVKAPADAA
jgi:hypothetical protein